MKIAPSHPRRNLIEFKPAAARAGYRKMNYLCRCLRSLCAKALWHGQTTSQMLQSSPSSAPRLSCRSPDAARRCAYGLVLPLKRNALQDSPCVCQGAIRVCATLVKWLQPSAGPHACSMASSTCSGYRVLSSSSMSQATRFAAALSLGCSPRPSHHSIFTDNGFMGSIDLVAVLTNAPRFFESFFLEVVHLNRYLVVFQVKW